MVGGRGPRPAVRRDARRGLLRRAESAALLPQWQWRRDVADGAPLRRDRTIRHKNYH